MSAYGESEKNLKDLKEISCGRGLPFSGSRGLFSSPMAAHSFRQFQLPGNGRAQSSIRFTSEGLRGERERRGTHMKIGSFSKIPVMKFTTQNDLYY